MFGILSIVKILRRICGFIDQDPNNIKNLLLKGVPNSNNYNTELLFTKFTRFKDGAFKYELGKYQANLLVNCIKKQKEVIDKAIEFTNKNWGTWCTHHLEYMTELQDILKEVE